MIRPSDNGTRRCGQASENTRQPSSLLRVLLPLLLVLAVLMCVGSCQMTSGMPNSTKRWGTAASKSLEGERMNSRDKVTRASTVSLDAEMGCLRMAGATEHTGISAETAMMACEVTMQCK